MPTESYHGEVVIRAMSLEERAVWDELLGF